MGRLFQHINVTGRVSLWCFAVLYALLLGFGCASVEEDVPVEAEVPVEEEVPLNVVIIKTDDHMKSRYACRWSW